MEELEFSLDFTDGHSVSSLFEKVLSVTDAMYESRWDEEDNLIDDESILYDKYQYRNPKDYSDGESSNDSSIFYERSHKEFLKKSSLNIVEDMSGAVYKIDDIFKQVVEAVEGMSTIEDNDSDNTKKKDDGKIYINPFVTAKDKARRDKTKYVEEHGDYLFEYDWNIISYDNYNTPDQDPFTYDYDFDLNKYKGVRGVFTDLGVEDEYQEQGENFHSSYELVEIKFLPKAYRYTHGITYTEAENRLLMIYDTTYTMVGTMGRPDLCPVDKMIEENPALEYIQGYIDKYKLYKQFCERFHLRPEWRDVHRHYGVWFREPIITYQIWEEWYETEDCFKVPFLESILSGAYFDIKRAEVEEVQSRLTEDDKIMRAYYRHKDIYPVDDEYYARYIPEDDAYEAVVGYDPADGAVLRHDLQFDNILEATEKYIADSEIDMSNYYGYDEMVDFCLEELDTIDKYAQEIKKVERAAEEAKPMEKLEEKLQFYKETETKKLRKEYGVDEEPNLFRKAFLIARAMSDADEKVEVETRPILEIVCDKAYRPSVELDTLDFNTKFKSFDDCETFDELLAWRKGKFDSRAKDLIKSVRDVTSDIFYDEITNSGRMQFGVDENRKALWDELYDETDEDEFPPLEYGLTLTDEEHIDGFVEMDISKIFEPILKAGQSLDNVSEAIDEFHENMELIRRGSELLCKEGEAKREKLAQYNSQEKEAVGLPPDDESYMHPKTAEEEGEEIVQMMRLKEQDNDEAARQYLN